MTVFKNGVFLFILGLVSTFGIEGALSEEFVTDPIVLNTQTDKTEISFEEVHSIYNFRVRRWGNLTPITVVFLPLDSEAHKVFLNRYLGISPITYSRMVENEVSTGRKDAVKVLPNVEEVIKFVGSLNGAIGYLNGVFYIDQTDGSGQVLMLEVR